MGCPCYPNATCNAGLVCESAHCSLAFGSGAGGESGGVPVGAGGIPIGAGGIQIGMGGIPVGAGGVPIGMGGIPVGAGGVPIGLGGAPAAGATGSGDEWIAVGMTTNCPSPGISLGSSQALPMCGIPGFSRYVTLRANAAGKVVGSSANAPEVCPSGWTYLGFNYVWSMCGAPGSETPIYIDQDPTGRLGPPGTICPAGSTYAGIGPTLSAVNGADVCIYDAARTVALLSRDRNGNGPATGNICPSGFDFVGGNAADVVCVRDGDGAVVNLIFDAQDRTYPGSLANPGDTCPAGWTWIGDYRGARVCVTDTYYGVAVLNTQVGGAPCPPDWTFLGTINGLRVCVR